jgi:cyclopropane-fatty-acyl-phospholipid synthase
MSPNPEHLLTQPPTMPAEARRVLGILSRLQHGQLTLELPNGSQQTFGRAGSGQQARVSLYRWEVFAAVLRSGDIGCAETFRDGDWSTPDLSAVVRLFLANRKALDAVIYGHWLGRMVYRIKHLLNRNTRSNSRKNIHAHYDLGNAFYRLWLDASMNYSSAWFEGQLSGDLQLAQSAKVRRALRMANVQPGARVLEIGCGWGALAEAATTEFQAQLVGLTLSSEQLSFANERLARLKPAHPKLQADLRLQDYRDVSDGPYDAVLSIEMLEAVGQAYWGTYFQTVARLLKPGGRACIQTIVIDDALFERYIHSTDFIQQYIFPGGCLPCPRVVQQQAAAAGLELVDAFPMGQDYAETLRRWRQQFEAQRSAVIQLGFDLPFTRLWSFYLAYCEAAFEEGSTNVVQYTLQKPRNL